MSVKCKTMLVPRLIKGLTYTIFIVWVLTGPPSNAQSVIEGKELIRGLKYLKHITTAQQVVHILQADPEFINISAAHANEQAIGRETVSIIAKQHDAVAAINGGFFKMGEFIDGLPAGVLKIKGQWYGISYSSRAAIGWSNSKNNGIIDRIQTKTNLLIDHLKFPVHAVNQPALERKAILYTDAYGTQVETKVNGHNIVILDNRVIEITPAGFTKIPKGGYVYCVGAKARMPKKTVKIGDVASVNIEVLPLHLKEHRNLWQTVDNIVGGTPLLLIYHKIIHDKTTENAQSNFLMQRHARTAVGLLPNGHWIFVVVEQSPFNGSPGMTIPELAIFMGKLGCAYALNLDGGGSSTLYINNKVVNHPANDVEEDFGLNTIRRVSDAILIAPKSK